MNKREKGKVWEEYAVKHIESVGYRVVARNWTCHWGELDIVALTPDGAVIAFVEVKFRDGWFGDAHEVVSFHKMRALRRTAQLYIQKEKPHQKDFRIDLIAITKFPGRINVEHFESI